MNTSINEYNKAAIDRLLVYMKSHCSEPFDANKHAAVIYFSASKLNKVFKELVGVGPGTYYRQLRINKAVEMYKSGVGSWTEVSQLVGYSDLPSFSKAFKRIKGYNPIEFTSSRQL